jgi:hypothetical protein
LFLCQNVHGALAALPGMRYEPGRRYKMISCRHFSDKMKSLLTIAGQQGDSG